MKSVFDKTTRDQLISRINSLNENSKAQWGKMNLNQMLRHCIMWEEVPMGKRKLKRTVMSRLFGKIFLRKILKDDSPLPHSLPAVDELKINEHINSDISSEKNK